MQYRSKRLNATHYNCQIHSKHWITRREWTIYCYPTSISMVSVLENLQLWYLFEWLSIRIRDWQGSLHEGLNEGSLPQLSNKIPFYRSQSLNGTNYDTKWFLRKLIYRFSNQELTNIWYKNWFSVLNCRSWNETHKRRINFYWWNVFF